MSTFKQMIQDGTIKRADAMKVRIADIHEEPGFNLRREGEDLQSSIDALTDYIVGGGMLPPIEVRPRDAGGVWIVDGHRRRRAYLQAIARGIPVEWIEVRAFVGNDVDRVARIMTSAEGRELSALETAAGYKRLTAFGLSPEDIGAKVNKTRQHVDQLLILANANADVQQMVAEGTVSATLAIDVVRKHGDGAGEFLRGKGADKAKVTAGAIKPKALPRDVVDDMEQRIAKFAESIPASERAVIFGASAIPSGTVVLPAAMVRELIAVQTAIVEARDKQAERARNKAAKAGQPDMLA
jgi:ParB/RepB/Spo0J family partition protein